MKTKQVAHISRSIAALSIGDITFQGPPLSESPELPAIIGNETPDPGPVDGE
jgi:hypothetical protein